MTPFENVNNWVKTLLELKEFNKVLDESHDLNFILKLNFSLIEEESRECLEAIKHLQELASAHKTSSVKDIPKSELVPAMVNVLKELSDVVVVCNHAFSQLGYDGDLITNLVTYNNMAKFSKNYLFNEKGKLVLNQQDKADLKKEINSLLTRCVEDHIK